MSKDNKFISAINKTIYYVQPTEKTQEYIEQYIGDHQMLLPEYLPMLVPPRDWKWINDEKKHKGNKIPFPLENGERGEYEEMLYNPKPFWE